MSHFTNDMPAAEAVTLAEKLSLNELELDLFRETSKRDAVASLKTVGMRNADYALRIIEHTNFIIPLLEHAIKAKNGDAESQQWLDSLK